MKAKYFSYSLAILLTAVAGCTKETSDLQTETKQKITISAECSTKTYGVETIKFHSKDKLSVFDTEGANNEFALPSGATAPGNAPATFEGEISSGSQPQYVVYPYDANASIAGDVMTVTVPAHYAPGNANSVLRGMNISVGEIVSSEGAYSAKLMNLCGLVGVEIGSYAIGLKNVKLSANEPLTGTVSFRYVDGAPVVTGIAEGHTSVDFDVMRDTKTNLPTAGKFYFSVLPGTYTGLKLTLTLASGETKEITTDKSLTVTRGSRILLPVTLADIQSAPVKRNQVVVELAFYSKGASVLYYDNEGVKATLPSASGSELTSSMTFYTDNKIDDVTYSFPFHIISQNNAKYRYQAGEYKGLDMNPGTDFCIVLPALPGYYLRGFKFAASNTAYKYKVSNVYGRENMNETNSVDLTVGANVVGAIKYVTSTLGKTPEILNYIYPMTSTSKLQILQVYYEPVTE